jgi:acyl carrier protein
VGLIDLGGRKKMDITYADYLNYLSSRFNTPVTQITRETAFTDDLGVDSLSLYSLITDVEKEYHIKLIMEDIIAINTVGKLFDYICICGSDRNGA